SKIDEQEATESGEGDDEEAESDGESEEEETREQEEESFDLIPRTPEDGKEDQGLRISVEERMQEEEEADELYQSLSTSSFVTSLLIPIIDPGMESIFTTGSSSVTPIPSPKSTMTPSIMTTTTTASQPPIPPTPILSDILQTLSTFASVFRFEDRVKSLEVNFSEFMRTNQSTKAVSNIPDQGSKRQREGGEHASASTLSEPATTSAGRSTTGTQSRQMSASESALAEEPVQTTCQMEEPSHPVFETGAEDQPIVQPSQHPEWFSQPRKPPTPDHTPIDFFNFIMNRLGVDTLTPELLAGPTYELMRGSCNSLTELEYHLEEVYKAMTD
nr:hypothetical protein [Tanacetum cinerariifolium]